MKKLVTWLGWTVLIVVLAVMAFVMVTTIQFGWEYDVVLSGSMEPVLNVGGLVIIRPVNPQSVAVGDIISFNMPGISTPVCHRVIELKTTDDGLVFRTKGDANEEADPDIVPMQAVTGRAVLHLPYVGNLATLTDFGRTPVAVLGKTIPAAVAVISIIGAVFIGLTIRDSMKGISRPIQRRRETLLRRRERLFKMTGPGRRFF